MLTHLILPMAQWNRCNYCLSSTDEKTEAQRGLLTFPRPQSQYVLGLERESKEFGSRVFALKNHTASENFSWPVFFLNLGAGYLSCLNLDMKKIPASWHIGGRKSALLGMTNCLTAFPLRDFLLFHHFRASYSETLGPIQVAAISIEIQNFQYIQCFLYHAVWIIHSVQ